MSDSTSTPTAQLDKADREHLEDVVTDMRDRVEANVRYQLEGHNLEAEPDADHDEDALIEAIERERVEDDSWSEAYEQYITGVGYTIVNRLAALRCLEVRDFIDEEVTVFREDGLTPAADRLVTEQFLMEDEAIIEAYTNACDDLQDEIELLFDTDSAYSQLDPDADTFRALCEELDRVPDAAWRADDVLGWVYEYYNVKLLDDLRRKGDREGLEPEDVPPANQFYTPHWVVRMLTDNSLGKLYLEDTNDLEATVEAQDDLTPEERKHRPLSPDETPSIAEFCTYLVPSEEAGEAPEFDGPEDLRVIDPACGSGHFLLYAFDVLERIWRAETEVDPAEIPEKILEHNLYGVDLDMRACQLAAFNLYLKARSRAAAEGADEFTMPEVGIVCADATVADVEGVEEVFAEVADGDDEIANALETILDAFEEVHGLGSLLDVRGTLGGVFEDDSDDDGVQITLGDDPREDHTLSQILHSLREAVESQRDGDSFLAQDLRSFVRLLDVLAKDYDVTLMNPPYGSRNRMPDSVKNYINTTYRYKPEFYINFFEVTDRLTKTCGRIGMLVPRTFMYKSSFQQFREEFVGDRGSFDFLSEFGLGILDNATVRTVGTVVRSGINKSTSDVGQFYRLHDVDSNNKESQFIRAAFYEKYGKEGIQRRFKVSMNDFRKVPGNPISYWLPNELRELYTSNVLFDSDIADVNRESLGTTKVGLQSGDDDRFSRFFWETTGNISDVPFAKGGTDAWVLPQVNNTVLWNQDGKKIKRTTSARPQNTEYYFTEALAFNRIKETGRRFGYLHSNSIFSDTGMVFLPKRAIWNVLAYANSNLTTALVLGLTVGRHWNVGEIGRIPWSRQLEDEAKLNSKVKDQFTEMIHLRARSPVSPYYVAPGILPIEQEAEFFYSKHPHHDGITDELKLQGSIMSESITEAAQRNVKRKRKRKAQLENLSADIDGILYDALDISEPTQQKVRDEIYLRTSESPEDRQIPDPDSVPETPENLTEQVKDLIHHFAMEAVRTEPDGIIPIHELDDQPDMLTRIVEQFEAAYDEYATDRLAEVDAILGDRPADEEAYPNLRAFITNDLFEYHTTTMENTPIMWRVSTERLVADANGEGFGCFLDYHSLDGGLLDRLTTQYLEPRQAQLREKQQAADRRRNDESLAATAQSEAAEVYSTAESQLQQCNAFGDVLQELGHPTPRAELPIEDGTLESLRRAVAAFRTETAARIESLEELRTAEGEAWFQETFSDGFYEKVQEWNEEWLDALAELETACEAYAQPTSEPVEAHLYDLFEYFNWRLKGSDHYSSSGILFMTYYFEREGDHLLNDDGQPHAGAAPTDNQLASLAAGVEATEHIDDTHLEAMVEADDDLETIDDLPPIADFKALAETIDEQCQTIAKALPSAWRDRAISEVTTPGYDPVPKHGVAINIAPLAEASIVPQLVEEKVI